MNDLQLGVDTTTPYLAVALWSPRAGALASISERVERAHARAWVEAVDRLFHRSGASRDDVGAVNVGIGPGSYTGTRIGIAAARGMAYAGGAPVTGVCTLSAMAWGATSPGDVAVVAVDARRGAVYAATFRRTVDGLDVLVAPAKLDRSDVRERWPDARWIEDVPPDPVWIARRPPSERAATPVYL